MTKQELASKIWNAANKLRKSIKASEYKDYIIGFMFYKYLSDKEEDYIREIGDTAEALNTEDPAEIASLQNDIGYFIHYDDLYSTWENMGLKLGAETVSKGIANFYHNLNEKYARVFYVYNRSVNKHSGVFDALDSGLNKLGENAGNRDRAVRDIVALIGEIPPTSQEYDVLGYIYEYLIKQFSSEAKKDGAFYTPHEVTSLMAKITTARQRDKEKLTVYDPCTGAGGLLLNIGKEAKCDVTYYGQELITETSNLAKMNLFMQDVPIQRIIVRNADTLQEDWPFFDDENDYRPLFVDICVANPPYSNDWVPEERAGDPRFVGYGYAPKGYADYAFLLHCLYHIKPDGIMAIVLPHGVLFRGGAEGEIRRHLVEKNNIETIISLPSNLFFATNIPVIIMILSKNKTDDSILFIDASQSYEKGKNQNVLRESDVQRIFDTVMNRTDMENYARLVSKEEIVENNYNLNIPRYVSAQQAEEPYDLYSVVSGKIADTELDRYEKFWKQFPSLRTELFTSEAGYCTLNGDAAEIVDQNIDVQRFKGSVFVQSVDYADYLTELLVENKDPDAYEKAKQELFSRFSDNNLIDKYAVYQKFAECWPEIENDMHALQKGTTDIFPEDMLIRHFFPQDLQSLKDLEDNTYKEQKEEVFDSLDEDTKALVSKDDGKLDAKKLKAAIKAEKGDTESLKKLSELIEDEKVVNRKIKALKKELSERAANVKLSDADIKALCVEKWINPLHDAITQLADQTVSDFTHAIQRLAQKYEYSIAELDDKEKKLNAELCGMMKRLIGSESQMNAIQMLMEELA